MKPLARAFTCLQLHRGLAARVAVVWLLPLLTGCVTNKALTAAKQPASHPLLDRIDHVEKVVVKHDTLLMLLDGRLTNSSKRAKFTLTVPLTNIEMHAATGPFPAYGRLKVSRDVIRAGWGPEIRSWDAYTAIPVAAPLHQDGYPYDIPWDRPVAYANSARLLPNATKTIYPIIEYDNGMAHPSSSLVMEFVYVDVAAKQAYTVIYVDQVMVTRTKHRGYYGLLPLTVPIDLAASPVYLGMYIYWVAAGRPF
jgi:hypothetical protein